MTQKKHFSYIWDRLAHIVKDQNKIGDANLMMELDFSPPSWKVWKSKFIEKSNCTVFTIKTQDETMTNHRIIYHKKAKIWTWNNFLANTSNI